MSDFNIVENGTKVPATYGAIVNNSTSVDTVSAFYIYTSISKFTNVYVPSVDSYNDVDDYFIVIPGYRLIVYQDFDWNGSNYTIDNTTGSSPLFKKSASGTANTISSCRLYFRGTLLNEIT